MSQAHSLPAASSESPELVAAEADYEALTEALMQTRRGRWFLTEHARRCREADHDDLRMALARIEQTLAAPREPAALAELQERLEALPRIEQALADYRDPPAMAELRESLGALARIEQTLAAPREPAALAELQERLEALPRIEQALADYRDPPAMAELRESLGALARIEQTLAAPREPAALAELQERLEALPRIEQALADYRDPPAMAELRESLGALARIEQTLAAPREPAALAELQERLEALPRIEQALADYRDPPAMAELREQVAAFAQALHSVRAEVAAQRPPEPDPGERARDREREEEVLRLLHEQRERLNALADIWGPAQTAPPPILPPVFSAGTGSFATADSLPSSERGAPAPIEPQSSSALDEPGIGEPGAVDGRAIRTAPAAEPAPILFNMQTSTADLLSQTMIFGSRADSSPRIEEAAQLEPAEGDVAVGSSTHASVDAPADESPAAVDAEPIVQATAPPPSPADQRVLAVADAADPAADSDPVVDAFLTPASARTGPTVRPLQEAVPAAHSDPIVQMFIDPEPPVGAADEPSAAQDADAAGASPSSEVTRLPAWLIGAAAGEPPPGRSDGMDAAGTSDDPLKPAELEAALQADAARDLIEVPAEAPQPEAADAEGVPAETECFAQSPRALDLDAQPEPPSEREPGPGADTEPARPATGAAHAFPSPIAEFGARGTPSGIAELTLGLLQKALFSNPEHAAGTALRADPPDRTPENPTAAAPMAEPELLAAIAALRRALGREEDQSIESIGTSELVILDDMPVRPPPPASPSAEVPAPPTDPLAPVYALSEEERIALFS